MWLKPCSKEPYIIRQLKQTAIYEQEVCNDTKIAVHFSERIIKCRWIRGFNPIIKKT